MAKARQPLSANPGATANPAGPAGAGGAPPIPKHLASLTVTIRQLGREAAQAQRGINRLGGEMKSGLLLATQAYNRALSEHLVPNFKKLQDRMIVMTARYGQFTKDQRSAVAGVVRFSTAIGGFQERLERVRQATAGFTDAASKGFHLLYGSVMQFVQSGLQGTVEGEVLAFQWQQISRQIAAIFLPVVRKVIEYLRQVVRWFQGLSGEQQRSIQKWALIAGGVLAAGVAFAALIKGIIATIAVLQSLNAILLLVAASSRTAAAAMLFLTQGAGAVAKSPVVLALLAILAIVAATVHELKRLENVGKSITERSARWREGQFTQEEIDEEPEVARIRAIRDDAERQKAADEFARRAEEDADAAKEKMMRSAKRRGTSEGIEATISPLYGLGRHLFTDDYDTDAHAEKAAGGTRRAQIAKRLAEESRGGPRLSGTGTDRQDLTPTTKGFESLADSFKRIQVSSLNKEDMPARDTAKNTRTCAERLQDIADYLRGRDGGQGFQGGGDDIPILGP